MVVSFQHIKDHHLFILIACLVLVDLVILVPWSVYHPMNKHVVVLDEKVTLR